MTQIGINLLWLVPGEVGGTESYGTRVLRGLAARPRRFDVTLYALPGFADAYPDLAAAFPVVTAPVTGARRPARVATEWSWLVGRTRRLDLMHHLGGTSPLVEPVPSALTIHDLQYLTFPSTFSGAKLSFLRTVVPRAARRARVVMTTTEFVKGTVVDRLGVPPERVAVVPLPVDANPPEPASGDVVRARYGLGDRPFFLYPAITYPFKNHAVLVEALARLGTDHADAALVLTGGQAEAEVGLREAIARHGLRARVVRPGRVPGPDLEALYREAAALVFPSRYEGFGAGVLEAMTRGCPVIAADATALPEVTGGAAVLVDPESPDGWAAAMCAMLEDDVARGRLAEAGRRRAAAFDPDATAVRLEAAYDQSLEGA